MNKLEELLIIFSEECIEVSNVALKCVRFGMDFEYFVHQRQSNRDRLESKLGDFLATLKFVIEEAGLREEDIMSAADVKLIKIENIMQMISHNRTMAQPQSVAPVSKPRRRRSHKKPR